MELIFTLAGAVALAGFLIGMGRGIECAPEGEQPEWL